VDGAALSGDARPSETGANGRAPIVGVLALQGDFAAHARMLERLGANVRHVRTSGELEDLDGLVIPGGESTTMMLGVEREGMGEPLRELLGERRVPVLGSCAGLIMLDRDHLGVMDIRAERNAFGRQISSFESDVELRGIDGGPIRGAFIRAPWIAEHGPDVEILASLDGHAIAARQGKMLAVAFHTELGEDDRLHRLLLDSIAGRP
jgi:5'-phosphate synthase pdxT subunit